jgi:hypothetical protein
MERPDAATGGSTCQGQGYTVTIDPIVVHVGDKISVKVTVPGEPTERSWVGLFTAGEERNLTGQWNYLVDIKPTYTVTFKPPSAGQYEIRLLLDAGYEKLAVSCIFSVQ